MFILSSLWVFIHLLGLFLLSGGLLGSVVTQRLLWNRLSLRATAQALGLLPLLRQFPTLSLAGSVLLLLSELLPLLFAFWTDQEMVWLTGKLIFAGLLLLNGVFIAKPATTQLIDYLMQARVEKAPSAYAGLPADYQPLRQRLSRYNLSQFGLLLLLLGLTVFEPF